MCITVRNMECTNHPLHECSLYSIPKGREGGTGGSLRSKVDLPPQVGGVALDNVLLEIYETCACKINLLMALNVYYFPVYSVEIGR